jgi:hypothetical protein
VFRTLTQWLALILAVGLGAAVVVGFYGCILITLRRWLGLGSRASWFERLFDRLNDLTATASEALWGVIRLPVLACVLLALGAWLIALLYLPHADGGSEDVSRAQNARTDLSSFVMSQLPATQLRLQQQGGFNLIVWMSDFESVLYPDRRPFVQAIGRLWCENKEIRSELVFLPSVEIRDIRNGKTLASYSCTLSRVSVD